MTTIQSIILIDDDNDCNLLTKFAIRKAELLVEIHIFNFAEEAIEFIKKQFQIFFLSSSVDDRDKTRALSIPLIAGYLEKPLSQETILKFGQMDKSPDDRYHTDSTRK